MSRWDSYCPICLNGLYDVLVPWIRTHEFCLVALKQLRIEIFVNYLHDIWQLVTT